MAKILTAAFDDNPGQTLVVTLAGITRSWNTFSEAVEEVIDARVYSGIHFRNSDVVGARMGRQVRSSCQSTRSEKFAPIIRMSS